MNTLTLQFAEADRLATVTQIVGFALWQLQESEGVAAGSFVLLAQAKKGMGLAEGNALVERAQGKRRHLASNFQGPLGLGRN